MTSRIHPRPRRHRTDVRSIAYRQARRPDMMACARVFVRSSRDLARRQGGTPPPTRPKHGVELEQVGKPGKASPRMLAIAARFDRTFRGTRRDADIRYVMSLPGARFFIARAGRATIGYAVVNEKGRVGPAGVVDPPLRAGGARAAQKGAPGAGPKDGVVVLPGVAGRRARRFFAAGT